VFYYTSFITVACFSHHQVYTVFLYSPFTSGLLMLPTLANVYTMGAFLLFMFLCDDFSMRWIECYYIIKIKVKIVIYWILKNCLLYVSCQIQMVCSVFLFCGNVPSTIWCCCSSCIFCSSVGMGYLFPVFFCSFYPCDLILLCGVWCLCEWSCEI
jgi:hypothetical protein